MPEHADRSWLVMKFGGTSVSSAAKWSTIAQQAARGAASGHHVLVVVSALAGVTDRLNRLAAEPEPARRRELLQGIEELHRRLIDELSLQTCVAFEGCLKELRAVAAGLDFPVQAADRARLVAYGELLASTLGAEALCSLGLQPVWQDARKLLRAIPDKAQNPLSVRCDDQCDPEMQAQLAGQGQLHITQGFIASDAAGHTCLLGRGGSDTSAACFAARLRADALEIWTDVPGMFSADPRVVEDARLLANLGYSEAQELASMGAKVLHPPSIQPARRHGIPVFIKDTSRPEFGGTRIARTDGEEEAQVKGVVSRRNVTVINMESPAMWRQAGFLAAAFAVFGRHGRSIDLISTSESAVTVTLDAESASEATDEQLAGLIGELAELCSVEVMRDCVSISLVGNGIRTILGKIAVALDVFQDRRIHLVTQSANDLNLTLVVDAEQADSLVRKLHQLLISSQTASRPEFGPSWRELTRGGLVSAVDLPWWRAAAGELHRLLGDRQCAYVYRLEGIRRAARSLLQLESVDRVLYSVKANDHPAILGALAEEGVGFECVSLGEVEHVLGVVSGIVPGRILFTPNFAPRHEYQHGFRLGVRITVDNSWIIKAWPETFAGREIFLRLDLEAGYGHHSKVITSGKDSKFGVALEHVEELVGLLRQSDIRVIGLHAHTGSGVTDPAVWQEQLTRMLAVLHWFPDAHVLDLGGGLGVPDRARQPGLDIERLDSLLADALRVRDREVWLEPGRYLVAESGVLLARVTQLKDKGHYRYVGVATGMNSLIRPALYGSYHEIVNLSRLDEPAHQRCRVVGPICETGDVLGESRLLPECREGDILLIANVGAYGRVMSSHYNRRDPAEELILTD